MPTTADVDVLVIGLGAVGSAVLHQATRLGARAVGIDLFHPPHDQGSSHGDTRITRQAIGEGRELVPLALRSNQIWEELESLTGRSLLTRNGALVLSSPHTSSQHHGSTSFVQDTIEAAIEYRIAHEILDAKEIRHRYPQYRLRGDEMGYFEPGAGFLHPEACVEVQLNLARRAGARVLTGERVLSFSQTDDGTVEVLSDKGRYVAAKVIVTAGPWLPKLLGNDFSHYFKIYRQVLCWFALTDHFDWYMPERFPVFIWIAGSRPRDMMYGFPAIDGPQGGLKIATEQYDATVDPDAVLREVSDAGIAEMWAEYVEPRFPDVACECLRSTTCLYTVTPDAKFIIDRLPNQENVVFASACSGHGFKHSAAIGEALASQVLGLAPAIDLSGFSLGQFARATG